MASVGGSSAAGKGGSAAIVLFVAMHVPPFRALGRGGLANETLATVVPSLGWTALRESPRMGSMKTLQARLHSIEQLATGIHSFELRPADGTPWPAVDAGAHVDLHLPHRLSRSYSLVNTPGESHRYVIAVNRDGAGKGGSRYLHDTIRVEIGRASCRERV